jgi:hypothetical protein
LFHVPYLRHNDLPSKQEVDFPLWSWVPAWKLFAYLPIEFWIVMPFTLGFTYHNFWSPMHFDKFLTMAWLYFQHKDELCV